MRCISGLGARWGSTPLGPSRRAIAFTQQGIPTNSSSALNNGEDDGLRGDRAHLGGDLAWPGSASRIRSWTSRHTDW